MSKILIFGLALALVLVSGPFIGTRADGIAPSCWAGFCPDVQRDMDRPKSDMDRQERDLDRSDATRQYPYGYGPNTPDPMGIGAGF